METAVTRAGAEQIDLHRLELRFAEARVIERRAVQRLARSIERSGQLVACLAVVEPDAAQWVLVDGYRRIAALRQLGRDTACVQPLAVDLAQALLGVLAGTGARPWAVIEEALLVRELVQRLGLSEHEVARGCGRDVSWVSRRLLLVRGLPEPILAAVRSAAVSSWAATRVLAPLARANGAHAERLLGALLQAPWSTRELRCWFEHYQRAPLAARERLVSHPQLFVEALRTSAQQRADERLRAGPDGQWRRDSQRLLDLIARLRSGLPALVAAGLPDPLPGVFERLCVALEALRAQLQRSLDHDRRGNLPQRADLAAAGSEPARHQPSAQAVA
jgi:ParB family transcriptional regulator, chromosome partitioning protein